MNATHPFDGNPVFWSQIVERWDATAPYLEMSPDQRLSEWDGDEWILFGDGVVGSPARWADDGGAL